MPFWGYQPDSLPAIGIIGAEEESACTGRRSFSPLYYLCISWAATPEALTPDFRPPDFRVERKPVANSAELLTVFSTLPDHCRRNPLGERPARHFGR